MSDALIQPITSTGREPARRKDAWRALAVCGLLVLAVLLVYSRTLGQGFLNWDDNFFVTDEPFVSGGLTWPGTVWAFTKGPLGEWYPLAMLSHMLDCQLYGLHPVGHHLTSVLLHAATAVALFLVLWRMTGELWPSALVAALFALHPLRVESVAWVAERRDVLSGLFFMLTLAAYVAYVRRPRSAWRYLAVLVLFALGLMSKAILVTVPALLLLLDYWPLGRLGRARSDSALPDARPAAFSWWPIVDKLPLFVLAAVAAALTMRTHNPLVTRLTLPERLANAAVSCLAYLGQLFVPVGLSPFYSHPGAGWPAWQVTAAVALLLAITAAAVIGRRSCPYLFVGWFWYLGMLVPVLGLTYVGAYARADRYTYLSQIGLLVALVWGAKELVGSWPARRWVFGLGSVLMLVALSAATWRQTGYWQDDQTLWEHALACDAKNVTAHLNMAAALQRKHDDRGAAEQFSQALEWGPDGRDIYYTLRAKAQSGLGSIAARQGDDAGAMALYEKALKIDADSLSAHTDMGIALTKQGDFARAAEHFQRCIDLSPDSEFFYRNLAIMLVQQGRNEEAIEVYRKAIAADPNRTKSRWGLALLLVERGEIDAAIVHFRRAIEIEPDVAFSYYQLAQLLRQQGKKKEADWIQAQGQKASIRYAEAQNERGLELAEQGKNDEAMAQFEMAISVYPDFARAHFNLAKVLTLQGDVEGAIGHFRRALEIDPNFAPAKEQLERLLKP